MLDSTTIRVHQHGRTAQWGSSRQAPPHGTTLTSDAWGARAAALTTKIHALVNAEGLPVAIGLTPGQTHDGASARDLLDTVGAR